MTKQERNYRRKKKALYFSTFKGTFPLLCEQGALHFHFTLGPTNCVAGSNVPYSIWLACISGKWRIVKGPLCSWGLEIKFMSLVPRTKKTTKLCSLFLLLIHTGHVVRPEGFELATHILKLT